MTLLELVPSFRRKLPVFMGLLNWKIDEKRIASDVSLPFKRIRKDAGEAADDLVAEVAVDAVAEDDLVVEEAVAAEVVVDRQPLMVLMFLTRPEHLPMMNGRLYLTMVDAHMWRRHESV